MANLLKTAFFIAEKVGMDKELDKLFDKIVRASGIDLEIQEIIDPLIETIPAIRNLSNVDIGLKEVETDDIINFVDGLNPNNLDYTELEDALNKLNVFDNTVKNTVDFFNSFDDKISQEYDRFDKDKDGYILDLIEKAALKAMESPLIIGGIAGITALAVLSSSSKVRSYVKRIFDKVKARIKQLVKNLIAKVKNWIKALKQRVKNLIQKLKKLKDKIKKLIDRIKQKLKEILSKFKKSLKKFDTKNISKALKDFKELILKNFDDVFKVLKTLTYGSLLGTFLIIDDTRKFLTELFGELLDFTTDVLKNIALLIPYLIDTFKASLKLLYAGFDTATILIFLFPALFLTYLVVYYIQLLEGKY